MTAAPVPRSGLSLDPRVLADLLAAPDDVREQALARIAEATTDPPSGPPLAGDLPGFRELPLGDSQWGLVHAERPAPLTSPYRTEVHVAAVGPAGTHLHDLVRGRLGRTHPASALAHASRTRSPQLAADQHQTTLPRPVIPARPGLPLPAPAPKGFPLR
jgi:hypothetical protein